MTGVSYEGTTANMVAALGDKISASANGGRGLAGVIPVASISHWYGYAYYDGVRYAGNSKVPTDEGIDTPLGFDFGFAGTLPADPTSPGWAEAAQARAGECGKAEHTMQGYSKNPDYGPFWQERDYRKDAAKFRVPVLIVHGWQDYNVKQDEGLSLYDAIPVDNPRTTTVEGVPFKKIWLTQSSHADGSGPGYQQLVDMFWARTLKGVHNGVESMPVANSLGRNAAGPTTFVQSTSWPPPGVAPLSLNLGAGTLVRGRPAPETTESYVDTGAVTEEASLRQAASGSGGAWVFHQSEPLTSAVRLAGSAVLDAVVNASTQSQQLDPLLVEVAPDGTVSLVERGFLNLDYRNGLAKADPKTGWLTAKVTFLPQDYTFAKGSRIGLILQSSNTVWAVPGSAGQMQVALSPQPGVSKVGTRLVLPLVGVSDPKAVLSK
jgi:X-Pro dipeptidyl-peptidase